MPRLLVVTDRTQIAPGRGLVETIGACVAAGAQAILLRELDLPVAERTALVARLRAFDGLTVVTARRLLPGAHGVHLAAAQTGLDARDVPFHGRSCHDDAEVRRAVGGGAAYLTISPVAASASKPGHGPALGVAGVRRAVELAGDVPVLALGGVDPGNAAAMRDAGAHGVAVMGALMRAEDPQATTRRLLEEVA